MLLDIHAHLTHELVDTPTAAVNDDRIHTHEPQQGNVPGEAFLQRPIGHCAAAEPDHQCRRVIGANERQRLGQQARLLCGGDHGNGHRVAGRSAEEAHMLAIVSLTDGTNPRESRPGHVAAPRRRRTAMACAWNFAYGLPVAYTDVMLMSS